MPCGRFRSVGLFLFVGVCEYMRRTFSELVKRFRGIVGGVFRSVLRFVRFFLFWYAL